MRLTLQNIGKIENRTTIEINGITVLVGVNGSGKSTVGKVLYSIYNTFHDIDQQIFEEKVQSIDRLMRSTRISSDWLEQRNALMHQGYYRNAVPIEEIAKMIERYDRNRDFAVIESWVSEINADAENDVNTSMAIKIQNALDIPRKIIMESLLERRFIAEFNMQIKNLRRPEKKASIEIDIKDEQISIEIGENSSVNILRGMDIVKNIVYIDDPYILDSVNGITRINRYGHKYDIIKKLKGDHEDGISAVDDVILSQQLKEVNEKLNEICSGELQYYSDRGFLYRDQKYKEDLSLVNVATGLKSYIILKTLLEKGYIEENGIVVMDEPEVHLHPEWMRVYAELVVMLQKVFGLNIVISTHSDAFLEFLELSCHRYQIMDKCKFYNLEENSEGATNFSDVSDDIGRIYKLLGTPFLRASEELDRIYENL